MKISEFEMVNEAKGIPFEMVNEAKGIHVEMAGFTLCLPHPCTVENICTSQLRFII